MDNVPGYLLLTGVVVILILWAYWQVPIPIFMPGRKQEDFEQKRKDLKKQAEEIVALASNGDQMAIRAIEEHFHDPKNSDFQGLIDKDEIGKPVFVDSSKKPDWYIEEDDNGELLVTKHPTNPMPLEWQPSNSVPLQMQNKV